MANGKEPASTEHIRSLYLVERWPVTKIANHLGVTRQAIYERMRRECIPYRSKKGLGATDVPRSELERLYVRDGLTIAEIARQMGHSWDVVGNALDRYGIERLNNRPLKELTPGIASMKIGDPLEIETDGRFPFWIYHEAKCLNFCVVIRTKTPSRFLIIRTPLLEAETVRSMLADGMSRKAIAAMFMSDPKTIKKMISESSLVD